MKSTQFIPLAALVLFATLGGCQPAAQDAHDEVPEHSHTPEVVYPEEGFQDLPFSDAVRVGNMLYLSGAIGNLPGTLELIEGGIAAETRQTMDNIQATLEKYGSSLDEVVKCTIMLEDISEWNAMNEVYVTYFPNHKPARSALGADGLALNSKVEIECFATVN